MQSSLRGWASLDSSPREDGDPGILACRLLNGAASGEQAMQMYQRAGPASEQICYDRFPEDVLVFAELTQLIAQPNVDRHEVLALVHKIHSPEKLAKSLFELATVKPLDVELLEGSPSLVGLVDEVAASRCAVLERLILVIETVHEASGQDVFPRWSFSASFLLRCQFGLKALALLRHMNGAKTACSSSLFADFLGSLQPDDEFLVETGKDFEETMALIVAKLGFWLEAKGLGELALLWLDTFSLDVRQSTVPVPAGVEGVFAYLRGRLCLGLGREAEAVGALLQASLLPPDAEPMRQLVCGGAPWDRLQFLAHCADLAVRSRMPGAAVELCGEALAARPAADLSLAGLQLAPGGALGAAVDLAATQFACLLELDRPQEAFAAISLVPDVGERPRACARQLVAHLLAHGEHQALLTQLPWGAWWDSEVIPAVQTLAAGGSFGHYRLLFALHSSRSDFKRAAAAMHRLAQHLRAGTRPLQDSLDEILLALMLARQTLLLCREDCWLLEQGEVRTPADLAADIALAEAQQFVLERRPAAVVDTLDALVGGLFAYGAYRLALRLLRAFGQSVDGVFAELAQELVYHQQQQEQPQPEPGPAGALEWVDLWLEGTECVRLSPAAAIGKVLAACIAGYPAGERSHYCAIVARAVLAAGCALPAWLQAAFLAADPGCYIRLLLRFGRGDDARSAAHQAAASAGPRACLTPATVRAAAGGCPERGGLAAT